MVSTVNIKTEPPYAGLDEHGSSFNSEHETTDVESMIYDEEITVDFVHRTAVDFLKKLGPGRAFLDANLSLESDPLNCYVKAMLGELRLWGLGKRHISIDIDEIMIGVFIAEDQTGMAQTNLCELIDCTMSVLDRKHSRWCPDSHWCTRWGKLTQMQGRDRDLTYMKRSLMYRSSSRHWFYSAVSEPPTCGDADAAPAKSMNFLSLAVSYGLLHYVQHMLERGIKSISLETLDYMLCCSTFLRSYGTPENYRFTWNVRIVTDLLKGGANPNAKFLTKTIWQEFLERTAQLWDNMFLRSSDTSFDSPDDNIHCLRKYILDFIEHGADVGAIWTFHFCPWLPDKGIDFNTHWIRGFDLQLSPLSLIWLCLGDDPDYPHIWEVCTARGALVYVRCQILEVLLHDEKEEDIWRTGRTIYELSELESKDFVEIFGHFVRLRRSDFKEAWAYLQPQISELCGRLDEARSGLSKGSESEWSNTNVHFQPDTMGLKISKARGDVLYI